MQRLGHSVLRLRVERRLADNAHQDHSGHALLTLGAAGAAGAITFAPTVIPKLGIGDPFLGDDAMSLLHQHAPVGGPAVLGAGLAGWINTGISHIPLVGKWLVSNSYASIAATTIIGIGGMLLANYLETKEDGTSRIKWSSVIRTVALVTSALIALPAILTGISTGLTYLGLLAGVQTGGTVAGLMTGTLGVAAGHTSAVSLLGATLPHLLLCGAAIIPLALAAFMGKSKAEPASHIATTVELVAMSPITRGQPCTLNFRLHDAQTGRVLTANDLAITHTRMLHTMIVDQGLNDYHHIHPRYDATTGLFTCQFTPQMMGAYAMWNDLARNGETQTTAVKTALPAPRGYAVAPMITHTNRASADGYTVEILSSAPLTSGRDAMVTCRVTDAQGQVVQNLEPIMGAYAHLAGFSRDGEHFIHCHPQGAQPQSATDRGNGILQFHIAPEWAGYTKFFLQLQCEGRALTIPFGQYIQPNAQFASRDYSHGMQHAMVA